MSRGDRILIGVLAAGLLALLPVGVAIGGQGTGRGSVTGPGGTTMMALDRDADYAIDGLAGGVTVRGRDGCVRVIEASCPDRVCEHTGAVSAPGSVIACVPNGIVIRVEGRSDERIDAVVR